MLIKFVSGEAKAGETRSVDEGSRDGDRARVRLFLIIINDGTALIDTYYARAGSTGMPSSRIASGNTAMTWPPTVTPVVL